MRKYKKHISIFLLIVFVSQLVAPSAAYALGGGPSQPEVQSFEPVGTTQMVDLFSGDYNYNIPLMDIDGYPINIAYHSGITMDQEASWVGLGWNLNPGVVNRNMRGIPDDFNGDEIKRTSYILPDKTYGVQLGGAYEIFGLNIGKRWQVRTDLSASLGVNYNNYKGLGYDFSVGLQASAGYKFAPNSTKKLGLGLAATGGLMLGNSSQGGAGLTASTGLDVRLFRKGEILGNVAGKIGVNSSISFNSNSATKSLTKISGSANISYDNIKAKSWQGHESKKRDVGFGLGAGVSINSFVNHSYTPRIQHNMSNYSLSFSFQYGTMAKANDYSFSLKGYFAGQFMENRLSEIKTKSYGYHYAENGYGQDEVLLDFNRDKDGAFTIHNPTLAIPQTTQDLYAFSGQGVGGMFKSYRSDLGVVYDHKQTSGGTSDSYGGGVSIGVGDIVKVAGDVYLDWTSGESGRWNNKMNSAFKYIKKDEIVQNPLYESAYLKVIGEKMVVDNQYLPFTNLSNPSTFQLERNGDDVDLRELTLTNENDKSEPYSAPVNNTFRTKRDKRNIFVKQLKASDGNLCLENTIKTGPGTFELRNTSYRKPDHFSEITVQNPDGNRYVYGIPAYSINQQEFTFTNAPNPSGGSSPTVECDKGLVNYDAGGNFGLPERLYGGIDKYFDKTETPAYAHSYLLTAILSPDYVDQGSDGPSDDDLGNYTRIDYKKHQNAYKWRVPFTQDKASYNKGLYNDDYDDNASIIYGEKEIWHVNTIEGRNHIAKFYVSKRKDAYGVKGIHGGIDTSQYSFKLDSIKLYSKSNLLGPPIKSVYFQYNYKLCPGVDNNIDKDVYNAQTGKLTLEKIYFTYGNSSRGKYNVYNFKYNYTTTNYSYNLKGYDRWGNFKHNETATCNNASVPLTSEFPYVEQNKDSADHYTQAWNLTEIGLPTGGKITIEYESDDYAYVQDKKAMQMYQVLGFGSTAGSSITNKLYEPWSVSNISGAYNPNDYIFVSLPNQSITDAYFKKMALQMPNDLYYNCMVNLSNTSLDVSNYKLPLNDAYEPIRGYAKAEDAGVISKGGINVGWVKIKRVNLSDEVNEKTNAISKAAWQFTRLNMPFLINPGANLMKSNSAIASAVSFAKTILTFIPDLVNSFIDGNRRLRAAGYASEINASKSWIRLNNLSGFKYGGGCRVKKLELSDEWNSMEPTGNAPTKKYGQVFDYTKVEIENGIEKTISSGVASYEPLIGNDENPFKKPIYYNEEQEGIPDEEYYSEEPFGESYFPGANIGYSRVTVKSIAPGVGINVAANKTGKVVHEFYTAQDFPTKTSRTALQVLQIKPQWIWDLLETNVDDRLTATQGYMVELNDMHGKPKAVWNYAASQINEYGPEKAFSGVKYEYFTDTLSKTLNNNVPVIYPNNTVSNNIVGVDAEMFSDTRENVFKSSSGGVQLNLDVLLLGIFPVPIPTGLPDFNNEKVQFHSAVLMKVVNKYGILKSTTAFENGATLQTENVLFDSETGEVVLTKTQNEFNDYTYNSTYPAHWTYENMGPAYKNTGATLNIHAESTTYENFKLSILGISGIDPAAYLVPGDEVVIDEANTSYSLYTVYKTPDNKYVLLDRQGSLYNFTNTNSHTLRVINSGRKNMQTMPAAQVVSVENPVATGQLVHNTNTKILQTSVMEYKDNWPKHGCYEQTNTDLYLDNEDINIMKYLLRTSQIKLNEHTPKYLCSDPCNLPYGGDAIYSKKILLLNNDSTYYKSTYRKYIDSCNLAKDSFIYSVTLQESLPSTPGNSRVEIAFYLRSGTFYNKLVNYHSVSIQSNNFLSFEGDSSTINAILNKTIDSLSYTGSYSPYVTIYNATLYFTDATSIPVEINVADARITLRDYTNLKTDIINPFRNNILNNWKPYRNLAYLENRLTENNSTNTNIRKDGTFKSYSHYWNYNGTKWAANTSSKWQYTKEITKYHITGTEAESKNPLEQYESVLYSNETHLPIAVGQNIKHRNIIAESFEEGPYEDHYSECGFTKVSPQYNYDKAFNNDTVAHTGISSFRGGQAFKVKYIPKDQTLSNGSNQYNLDTTNTYGSFSPDPGKYIVSAWVKVGSDPKVSDYAGAAINLLMITTTGKTELVLHPKGKIIEGWQRISAEISIPANIARMSINFMNDGNELTYFDDFRIYPIDGLMKSYVYDKNHRLMAELDENNYATFYEYDEEGNLARVKKETERGIVTLKEVRSSFKKNN